MALCCNSYSISLFLSTIFFFLFIPMLLLFPIPTNSISFSFPHPKEDDITALNRNVGAVTYSEPIQLRNITTGRLADFDTHFSLFIKKGNNTSVSHGITFFLAPFKLIFSPISRGGYLGSMSMDAAAKNYMKNQMVAVEFDIFKNSWDSSVDTVGISVNAMISVANVSLGSGITKDERTLAYARVTYNSVAKNLIVFLTYDSPVYNHSILRHTVDLSKVLPEQIGVGFIASMDDSVDVQYKILSWEFDSTFDYLGEDTSKSFKKRRMSGMALKGLVIAVCVFGCGLGFSTYIWLKKRCNLRKNGHHDEDANSDVLMNNEFEKRTGPKRFSYGELVDATSNFDEGGKLGEGGFGGVYRGFLNDMDVAVKKISGGSRQGKKEYESEVRIISQLRHKNLVKLLGWYHEKNELLLVYELMPNRSLDKHLYRGENVLPWDVRYKIAIGLASALLYLHEEWEQCVVHRDIKPSNVMLDSNFNAKLGDFGLARLIDHGLSSRTTVLAGTMGYLAPECLVKCKTSKRSDIYSFGIVALEIACGRKPVDVTAGVSLVKWVAELYDRGKIIEAADERLNKNFDEQQMNSLMVIGLWCAHSDPKARPSIRKVTNFLSLESSLPDFPSNLPAPVYHLPSMSMCRLASTSSLGDSTNSPMDASQYCTCVDCTRTNFPPSATPSNGSSSIEALLHSV